ncbi:MAG: MoaD/ThiS family protein [Peptococcaceae bacterium]|jgi:putative ubiquitin-RnfH superfamily antitoxin RatB of RatAB toxin-antitoxin module|nr:MoaD/ThiS family protein [Peptococcaceae bacterium]
MRVTFRFMCVDLPTYTGGQKTEITDGATVEQAMVEYSRLYSLEDSLTELPQTMFLIDKKPARLDTVLRDGDDLLVMRILHGG